MSLSVPPITDLLGQLVGLIRAQLAQPVNPFNAVWAKFDVHGKVLAIRDIVLNKSGAERLLAVQAVQCVLRHLQTCLSHGQGGGPLPECKTEGSKIKEAKEKGKVGECEAS